MKANPMTTLYLHASVPVAPANPRGARAGAAVFVALYRLLAGLIRAATSPQRRLDKEVQAVRELAWQHRRSDPRFAADLLAAADRFERLHGLA